MSNNTYIPYGRQSIDEQDIAAVTEVLCSDWLTQGPNIAEFETVVAEYCAAKYATAVSSATAALHIACLALGLGKDDVLWTSANTFVASANCALYCGAEVDFIDIDPKTYNMSVEALEEKLVSAAKQNKLPKIVIPVHFAGQSCDMQKIKALADKYGFKIIEDASHAIGGNYQNNKIGSCQYSDITIFSFHPVKIITTGEGGMLLTNQEKLHNKLQMLRTHGITKNKAFMENNQEGDWYYEQQDLGFNYRITDLQAALGISQLKKIDNFIKRRSELVARYNDKLQNLPIQLPYVTADCSSSWHLYVIQTQNRRQVFDYLRQNNIGVMVHYLPVYLHPYYRGLGFKFGYCSNAEKYYNEAISLPMFPALTNDEQDRVVTILREAV